MIEQAQRSPESVIERLDKKKLSEEDLEQLRSELRARSLDKGDRYALPWPWAEETSERNK